MINGNVSDCFGALDEAFVPVTVPCFGALDGIFVPGLDHANGEGGETGAEG